MDNGIRQYEEAVKRIAKAIDQIPTRAATVAVNFTKERFREQNWLDNTPTPWPKRKRKGRNARADSRKVLVKSGRLMRSWRKITANSTRAIIGTDVPYARAHNDGLKVQAVAQIGSYSKRGFSRKRKGRTESVQPHTVKAHSRNINFTMPKRQFVGQSAVLNRRISELITNDLSKAIQGT